MAGTPWFYTIRKHRKKSVAAAIFAGWLMNYGVNKYREYMIRRELCHEAKAFGDSTLPSLKKPRRLVLFFNPSAGSGSAETLFKKNAEPILHIAALDVTVVKTDYEGQIKTLTQYIDPNVDAIVVAGGDGTLLEVITGLLRRSDEHEISNIPVGVIPLGTRNSFSGKILSNTNVTQARTIGSAALAIVKGFTKPVDVIEIKGKEGRSTFALSKLHWGAFRDAIEKQDKYWMFGPFRRKMSHLITVLKDWPPLLNAALSYPVSQPSRDSVKNAPINQRVSFHAMATACCEEDGESDKRQCSLGENSVADGWISTPVQTFGLSVEPVHLEHYKNDSFLKVKLWPSDFTKMEFIETGWNLEKMEKEKENSEEEDSTRHRCLMVKQLSLAPQDDKVSWFSIDGEPFEAKPVTLTLLPQKLHFFCHPNKCQDER